ELTGSQAGQLTGTTVTVGIRPEDLRTGASTASTSPSTSSRSSVPTPTSTVGRICRAVSGISWREWADARRSVAATPSGSLPTPRACTSSTPNRGSGSRRMSGERRNAHEPRNAHGWRNTHERPLPQAHRPHRTVESAETPADHYDRSMVDFAPSARSTLGVEWELALLDSRSLDLTPAAETLLADV